MSEEVTSTEAAAPQAAPAPVDDSAKREAEELRAKVTELTSKVKTLSKSASDATKASASAAELKAALDAKEAEEEKLRSAVESYEKSIESRADRMLGKLEDEDKKRIEKYRSKLSKADWLEMVEDAVEARGAPVPADGQKPNPPAPTPGGRVSPRTRELQPRSLEVLQDMGYDVDNMQRPEMLTHDAHYGNARFANSVHTMKKRMAVTKGTNWNTNEAEKRGK